MGHFFKGKEFLCISVCIYIIDARTWHTQTFQAVPWGCGRVGRLRKTLKPSWLQGAREVPWLGNGKKLVGSVWFAAQEGQECLSPPGWGCACTQGPVGLLWSCCAPRDTAAGEEALEFLW